MKNLLSQNAKALLIVLSALVVKLLDLVGIEIAPEAANEIAAGLIALAGAVWAIPNKPAKKDNLQESMNKFRCPIGVPVVAVAFTLLMLTGCASMLSVVDDQFSDTSVERNVISRALDHASFAPSDRCETAARTLSITEGLADFIDATQAERQAASVLAVELAQGYRSGTVSEQAAFKFQRGIYGAMETSANVWLLSKGWSLTGLSWDDSLDILLNAAAQSLETRSTFLQAKGKTCL